MEEVKRLVSKTKFVRKPIYVRDSHSFHLNYNRRCSFLNENKEQAEYWISGQAFFPTERKSSYGFHGRVSRA